MKIIIVPNIPDMSGRHYCIAKALVEQGHEVHYMKWELPYKISIKELIRHLFTSLIPTEYKYEKFFMHKVSRLPYFWPVINGWLFKFQARRLFKKLNADIIFTESFTNETEIPRDLPYIYDLADDYAAPAEVYGSPLYKFAFKILGIRKVMERQSKHALAVTAVSEILVRFARNYNKTVFKLPNGVDKKVIESVLGNKKTYSNNKYSLVYVTRFGEWSRAIETLQTVKELRDKEFPSIELSLVGDGSESTKIKQFISENNAEAYIHYHGFIYNRKKMFGIMNRSTIGLNISDKNKWRDAAYPIKVIEYSALGKKVVSTNLAEVVKLRLPNIHIFTDKNKKQDFKTVLKQALLDTTPQKDFSVASKNILQAYSWEGLTSQLVNLSKTVIANNQKIVHVTHAYPPALGGLEKVVQQLATMQKKIGLNTSVITGAGAPSKSISVNDTLPVSRLKSYTVANARIIPGLFHKLTVLRAHDIVHLHLASAYLPEIVWLASKIRGFSYIVHLHMDLKPTTKAGILLKLYKPFVLKFILQDANYVAVLTREHALDVHKQYGISASRVKVIPNGVEDTFYSVTKRALRTKPRLLFVGRLDKQKNIPLFLRALEGISEKFETTIVGEGPLKKELVAMSNKLVLKNVRFVGRADGDRLVRFYKNADILVLPSLREGLPLVALEAMAMGLPIIATDVIGNRDVIKHTKNGLLVPLNDVAAMQKAILRTSSNSSYYHTLSKNARQNAEQYSWMKVSNLFKNLYKEVHTYE